MILESHLDEIALAHANELSGRLVPERPIRVRHAVGELFHVLFDFDVENDSRRVVSRDRRRNVRRRSEYGPLDALWRVERVANADRSLRPVHKK